MNEGSTMAPKLAPENLKTGVRPRILVVDDEPMLIDVLQDIVGRKVNCRILVARDLRQAREIMAVQSIDLLVTDLKLPDGDGMSLLAPLHDKHPHASAIIMTGEPSVDLAISALRQGAVDFVPKPFSADQIADRVTKALALQAGQMRVQKRLGRLRSAVRRLNEARKVVSRKVDLLCNDLITAYGELSKQLDVVRIQEGFRRYITETRDLEQMLCHTMDWLLRQLGYSNVAVWLAADDQDFQLGAYMKYTIPGDASLCQAMREGVVRNTLRQGLLRYTVEEAAEHLTPAELAMMPNQCVMGASATYLGEPLAAIVMFRSGDNPFTDEDAETLRKISPIFGGLLATLVRGDLDMDDEDADAPGGLEGPEGKAREDREDRGDADWWKRGENPPF